MSALLHFLFFILYSLFFIPFIGIYKRLQTLGFNEGQLLIVSFHYVFMACLLYTSPSPRD